jgi:hypothetical protein
MADILRSADWRLIVALISIVVSVGIHFASKQRKGLTYGIETVVPL